MVTDKATNRLIITASDRDYEIIEGIIKQLDVKRPQVYVEAVVLEMSADRLRELGTDLGALFGYTKAGSDLLLLGGFNETPPSLIGTAAVAAVAGAAAGAAVPAPTVPDFDAKPINARAVLKALQSTPNANVLSTPQILTSDRQKAEIVVAQNVPFPGAQSQSVGGNVQTTIERKDVGIILRLTPTVMEKARVKLDVYQEISSVVETAGVTGSGVNLGPTTNKRSASTAVVVNDGQTAVIGGLMRDNLIVSTRSIPLLGSIPFLGWAFKSETKRIEKTNLLIFITPYIVPETEGENSLDNIRMKKVEKTMNFMEQNRLGGDSERGKFLDEMINPPK